MKKERFTIADQKILDLLVSCGKKVPDPIQGLEPHVIIRTIRNAFGMTQAQLAERAGMPQSHLAKIETGKVDIQLSTLRKIFKAMDCAAMVVPKFLKSPRQVAVVRDRSILGYARGHIPIRIVEKEDDRDTLKFWLAQPPQARIDAVEFLRRQCCMVKGWESLPRMVRSIQLREFHS